jgi:type II secretory ATPase GspE/PulE/Tfp pilus assembly ATPase PilB-like protein
MRQDAEVIFLGEIRDEESAIAATQLAQTGHLVVSTLHTRDSLGVLGRLGALGIDSFTLASTLIGSMAQRLVPALCPKCKVPDNLTSEALGQLNNVLPIPEGTEIFKKGPGCDFCNVQVGKHLLSSGTKGGMPIFELFVVDDEISDLIAHRKSRSEILYLAQSKGMLTLPQESLLRVYQGFISFESVKSLVLRPSY